ncbi:ABCB family ABC transporter ATP-binding protein/permease [Woodsholea maritima]|uniref:ABCB family ABC transporter ATP-binding protein/permease n=1 Tax=Woodsholea maritima TaxID=240237 RepID=UPI00037058D9|nr:ABC transporter ATP-binding protein/permease [Woodsholea maritima]
MPKHTPASKPVFDTSQVQGRLAPAVARLFKILASHEMRRWRLRIVIAFILTLGGKVLAITAPILFGEGINVLARAGEGGYDASDMSALWPVMGLFITYGVLRMASQSAPQFRDAIFSPVSQDAQRITAVQGFAHVQNLSLSFHQTKRTGAMQQIIHRAAAAIDFLMSTLTFNIVPTAIELTLAAIVVAVRYGIWFSVITVLAVLAYAGATYVLTEWRTRLRREMNEAETEVSARAVDSMSNFETVKAFAAEPREIAGYDEARQVYARAATKTEQSLALLNTVQTTIMSAGLLAMAMLGGYRALQGQLEVGDVAALTMILMSVYQPLNILGWVYRQVKQGAVDLEKLFHLMEQRPEVSDKPGAPALHIQGGGVRFEGVCFAHEGRDRSVEGVSFEIEPGSYVGLAGPSGAGKSTLLRLLFRFYDVEAGRIVIDGQDIREVTQASLRQNLGLVPQEVVLFNSTLGANILYGRPDAHQDEINAAIDRAQLRAFVDSLPDGLNTRVGERGVKLSGGEKQRVGVARAILKDPPILILDEATSALDSQTEAEVQAALNEAAKGRTTIAIAHRLSTIAGADQILVMEAGRLAEHGTHTQLITQNGIYGDMWRRQGERQDNQV